MTEWFVLPFDTFEAVLAANAAPEAAPACGSADAVLRQCYTASLITLRQALVCAAQDGRSGVQMHFGYTPHRCDAGPFSLPFEQDKARFNAYLRARYQETPWDQLFPGLDVRVDHQNAVHVHWEPSNPRPYSFRANCYRVWPYHSHNLEAEP